MNELHDLEFWLLQAKKDLKNGNSQTALFSINQSIGKVEILKNLEYEKANKKNKKNG